MTNALRRYAFSERLADILGESRRDLRLRVTLMVSDGLAAAAGRGTGSPPATPDYAADLLIGVMAAPQQVDTIEAIRCYRALVPGRLAGEDTPGVVLGTPRRRTNTFVPALPVLADRPPFGRALARLLDLAREEGRRPFLEAEVFGIWISRGFPAAALQFSGATEGRRAVVAQRYRLAPGARPPAWLDPARGGRADPGLLHATFLPVGKLIEIGMLTSPAPNERTTTVIDLRQKISDLARLARDVRDRRPWENFLSDAAVAEEQAEHIDPRSRGLVEVEGFGSNPGNLRMLTHVPDELPAGSALVVVLHGCTQTAASYDTGTGWSTLADRHGFAVLLPEQRRSNNPLRCFDWFREQDYSRDGGEPESILQMVERMIADHGLDRSRVFVTGLSAGGAMTSVMLATHPELFAGGAVLSGVPYRCAKGLQEGFQVIFQGSSKPADEWGDLVRAATSHAGPWPHVQVWHGDADTTVKPVNGYEVCKQWANVHGLAPDHTEEQPFDGYRRLVWRGADGRERVELFRIAGMAHGAAIDPFAEDGCGAAGPFMLDVGISSTEHIARSWGLTATRRQPTAARERPAPAPEITSEIHATTGGGDRPNAGEAGPQGRKERPSASQGDRSGTRAGQGGTRRPEAPAGGIDLAGLLARSMEAAARMKDAPGGRGAGAQGAGGLAGIDIPGIIGKSFEAAGLLKEGEGATSRPTAATVAGVDIGAILSKSFEAAGLFRPAREERAAGSSRSERPHPESAGSGKGPDGKGSTGKASTGKAPADAPGPRPGGFEWRPGEWELLTDENARPGEQPTLHGRASSGLECDVGEKVRSIACALELGHNPTLGYRRRLDIGAGTNMMTTAAFRVRVDGECVDEVMCTGMTYAEPEWTERAAIDLGRFAGRKVVLAFEVSADANVCVEAWAEAHVRDILLQETVAPEATATGAAPGTAAS